MLLKAPNRSSRMRTDDLPAALGDHRGSTVLSKGVSVELATSEARLVG